MYFVCHVTPQNHSAEMSCIFIGESSFQHVTTLKSLVTIGILIVWGKMFHQKRGSHKYVLPLKNWVDWTTTSQEKNVTTSKMYILGRSAQTLKIHIFALMTSFYDFSIKLKPVEQKWTLSPVWKLEMLMMLLCMFGIFNLR